MQLVKRQTFRDVIEHLKKPSIKSCDTETFGLRWYDKHSLFSIIIADEHDEYYFNFLDAADHTGFKPDESLILPKNFLKDMQAIFEEVGSRWFMHNAKFDMGMLSREGLMPTGVVHCTEAVARLCDSSHFKYNLKICMERMARELGIAVPQKSDAVSNYIAEHKLFTVKQIPGKTTPTKDLHFNLVPLDVLVPYGCADARATWELGMYQINKLREHTKRSETIGKVYYQERQVTKVCLRMEKAGLPLDVEYCKAGYMKLQPVLKRLEDQYKAYTGKEFVDSANNHEPYFVDQGFELRKSKTGETSFDKAALESYKGDPVADIILEHRKAAKLSSTYFSSYLYYVGDDGAIHPSFWQSGTRTGRMSCSDPNLQNVPKPDEDEPEDSEESSTVRRCFKPPPGEVLFMPDYDQMEYRLMLDQAEEMDVIKLILDGMDVHTATAQMMNVTRKQAKTINFMLLYGGGIQKLADALKITYEEAKQLKALYFDRLPNVKRWQRAVIGRCQIPRDGVYYTKAWDGRLFIMEPGFGYKGPNYEIQGGSAGIVKKAMVGVDNLLHGKRGKLRCQVHDELLITLPKEELWLQKEIIDIMETVYPAKHLPLTVGAKHSWISWGDPTIGQAT